MIAMHNKNRNHKVKQLVNVRHCGSFNDMFDI